MKKKNIAFVVMILSLLGTALACLGWCLTEVGALGAVTLVLALTFTVSTYFATQR